MSTTNQIDRVPPNDVGAEMCVLGSLMLSTDPAVFAETKSVLKRSMFYSPDHQIIFDAIVALSDRGSPLDAVTVRAELECRRVLNDIGGVPYLMTVINSVPSASHGPHYAQIVRGKAGLRSLIATGEWMIREANRALPSVGGFGEVAQEAASRLARLASTGRSTEVVTIGNVFDEVVEQMRSGGVDRILTGFREFDDITTGVGIGEMVVVAARPSMGKSALARQIALQVAEAGTSAGIISLEEGRDKIGRNLIAARCEIDNHRVRAARGLTGHDWNLIEAGVAQMRSLPLCVADRPRTMSDIRSAVTVMRARHGIRFLVVDHLHRIRGNTGKNKYEEISAVSGEISDLIKDNDVAGLLLAQLNRNVEKEGRPDKRPNQSDLRDSGYLEQDADGIVFLHREDYYNIDNDDYAPTGEAELIIAKWRDGIRGKVVKLRSDLAHQRFLEADNSPF